MIAGFASRSLLLPDQIERGSDAIVAHSITVDIDGTRILDSVDLVVRAGEVLALVGPNGAGKSTLLGVLAGDQPAEGGVELAGRPLASWNVGDLARRRAVLAQQNTLSFPFIVIDVVEMGRAPWARTPMEDDDELVVQEAMERTGVTRFAERQFPSLSGGERARVSMARVLAQRTGIFMLDEPTAALDIRHQEDVLQVARERAEQGDAVVVVLHDLSLAGAYADWVALLSDGRMHSYGRPAEVLTAENISSVYQYPVEVIHHPTTGEAIVLPVRPARPSSLQSEEIR